MINKSTTGVKQLERWRVCTDGGCPSNPGPGAFAFVIEKGNGEKVKMSGFLATATNNQAEYRAVNAALIFLNNMAELPAGIDFWSDSELIVNQLNGLYGVHNETLRPFYLETISALRELKKKCFVTITHFKREFNSEADELCNESLRLHGIEIVSKKRKTFGRSPK